MSNSCSRPPLSVGPLVRSVFGFSNLCTECAVPTTKGFRAFHIKLIFRGDERKSDLGFLSRQRFNQDPYMNRCLWLFDPCRFGIIRRRDPPSCAFFSCLEEKVSGTTFDDSL